MTTTLAPQPSSAILRPGSTPKTVHGGRREFAAVIGLAGQSLLSLAAVLLVGLFFADYFADYEYRVPYAVAAIAGTAVAVVASGRRTLPTLAVSYIAGAAAVEAGLLFRTAPAKLIDGLTHAWGRMLSVNLPADTGPQLLVLPVLLAWTTAFAAVTVSRWSHSGPAPVVPLVAEFILALVLVAGAQHSFHTLITLSFLAVVALLVRVREISTHPVTTVVTLRGEATRTRPASLGRRLSDITLLIPVVVVLLVVAWFAGALLPGLSQRRADVRTIDPPPVLIRAGVTPLSSIKPQLVGPDRRLFQLRMSGPGSASITRVRTATLADYDGIIWSSDERYLVAGRVLPANRAQPRDRYVGISVRLDDWSGPFLPVVGDPTGLGGQDITGERAGFESSTGTLVWAGQTPPGTTYTLTGVAVPPDAGLTQARPDLPPNQHLSPMPALPQALTAAAQQVMGTTGTPYVRLKRLEAFMQARPYDLDVAPGHSLDTLSGVVAAASSSKSSGGFAEQHAAAFALLARSTGLPARVAVGYLLPQPQAGIYQVTTNDAHAWPEVYFDAYGWVPFEPTDITSRAPDSPPNAQPPSMQGTPPQPPPPSANTLGTQAPTQTSRSAGEPIVVLRRLTWVLLIVLLAALLVAATTPLMKAAQMRRRNRGTPGERIMGAWEQALDHLLERAFRAQPGQPFRTGPADTPNEVAAKVTASFPRVRCAMEELAHLVTAVRQGGYPGTPEQAEQAWFKIATMRTDLDRGRHATLVGLRAAVDPRPLWRQAVVHYRTRRMINRLGWDAT